MYSTEIVWHFQNQLLVEASPALDLEHFAFRWLIWILQI